MTDKIITGVSTGDEFVEAVNKKGTNITNESTPKTLLNALNSIGGDLTFKSTNEEVLKVVNAESSTTRTVQIIANHTTVGAYEPTAEVGSTYTLPETTAEEGYKFIEWEDEEGNKLKSPITVPEGCDPLKLYAESSKILLMNQSDGAVFDINYKGDNNSYISFADAVNGVGCDAYFGFTDEYLDKVIALDDSGQSTALDIGSGNNGLIGFNVAPGQNIKIIQMEGSSFEDFGTLTGNYTITNETTLRQLLQYIVSSTPTYINALPSGQGGQLPLAFTGIENARINVFYSDLSDIRRYFKDVAVPFYHV